MLTPLQPQTRAPPAAHEALPELPPPRELFHFKQGVGEKLTEPPRVRVGYEMLYPPPRHICDEPPQPQPLRPNPNVEALVASLMALDAERCADEGRDGMGDGGGDRKTKGGVATLSRATACTRVRVDWFAYPMSPLAGFKTLRFRSTAWFSTCTIPSSSGEARVICTHPHATCCPLSQNARM